MRTLSTPIHLHAGTHARAHANARTHNTYIHTAELVRAHTSFRAHFYMRYMYMYQLASLPLRHPTVNCCCCVPLLVLEVGRISVNGKIDQGWNQAHFGAWCVISAPLILGMDLTQTHQVEASAKTLPPLVFRYLETLTWCRTRSR